MPVESPQLPLVSVREEGARAVFVLGPGWSLSGDRRELRDYLPAGVQNVRVELARGGRVETALVLALVRLQAEVATRGGEWDESALPEALRMQMQQLRALERPAPVGGRRLAPITALGEATTSVAALGREMLHFLGETALAAMAAVKDTRRFRWADWLYEMQQAGASALPIVGLVSFLVGVTLAYTGAIILRQYGGDIYVADLVGLSMVREMGALMTAVVMAGRTGAAYAAQLANMKANEEIDALETFGFRPFNFLVLPRLCALGIMMPMLSMYANALGIFGGMLVAMGVLSIPPTAYFVEMATIVGTGDIGTGLLKATTFGLIVGMSGCFYGMRAEPNAAGVGQAATSSVVTAILLTIVADAIYAVVFNMLGW